MPSKKIVGTLTCPFCGGKQTAEIPTTMCLQSYVCNHCKREVEAKKSCCVFCDYGDEKCPTGHG